MDRAQNIKNRKKAAAVIVAIGSDYAAKIYKYLKEDEIEQLTLEVAVMQRLSPDVVEATLNEFYELCLAQKYITEGGIEYARAILDKVLGPQSSSQLIEKITRSLKTGAFDFLRKTDPRNLLTFIQNEHPQTIALILSYATAEQASAIISDLPRDVQVDVVERISTMDRTSPEIVKEVEKILERKFSSIVAVDYTEIGGVKYMAKILNSVDRGTEKYILETLGKKEPNLAEEIRKHMFVFEDIVTLDSDSIQRFLREVDSKDLLIALKGANEDVSEAIYSNMSSRMREIMKEDSQYLRSVRVHDVEEAQQKIVNIIRDLEEKDEIYISRGRKDEILV